MRGTKLTVTFGLVSVPCKRGPVSRDTRIRAKRVCPEHMHPIQLRSWCEECDAAVEPVSAYEVDGAFVEVDRDSLAVENDKVLALTAFVDDFDPAFYEKTEILAADKGGENTHSVLAEALRVRGGMAVGVMTINKARRQVGVRWSDALGCLTLHHLALDKDVRWDDAESAAPGDVPEQQVELAIQILESLADECDLDARDEYDERIREAIDGASISAVEAKVAASAPADLMDAMRATVAEAAARRKGVKA